jgi:hypothetical protein
MESPQGWTLLTSSLAVADLQDIERTWLFLQGQGVVVVSPTGAEQLRIALSVEISRGRITGGTLAYRVAQHLLNAGVTAPAATIPDPFGRLAARRWQFFQKGPGEGAV